MNIDTHSVLDQIPITQSPRLSHPTKDRPKFERHKPIPDNIRQLASFYKTAIPQKKLTRVRFKDEVIVKYVSKYIDREDQIPQLNQQEELEEEPAVSQTAFDEMHLEENFFEESFFEETKPAILPVPPSSTEIKTYAMIGFIITALWASAFAVHKILKNY